jgi:hypothetical protein
MQQDARRDYFEAGIPYGSFYCSLSLPQPVFSGQFDGQAFPFLSTPYLNNVPRFQLSAIPTVGFSDPILSYLSVVQFIFDGGRMLKNGYEKVNFLSLYALSRIKLMTPPTCLQTSPGLFKIAQFRRWMVLATGSQLIDDIRMSPDNVLSATEPKNEVCF